MEPGFARVSTESPIRLEIFGNNQRSGGGFLVTLLAGLVFLSMYKHFKTSPSWNKKNKLKKYRSRDLNLRKPDSEMFRKYLLPRQKYGDHLFQSQMNRSRNLTLCTPDSEMYRKYLLPGNKYV